ncbi:hypothetical protein THRCLA_06952 [Thraustotheca clavata]|uniref:WRKY19-like zinc finger domain-containing protein n=1 Tax=Thraustotheca clavata TaxID=74557 RepID=A0A1V9ZHK8_9STRA|nr:hypothetical protein THRCLA_06952 [Thraustotheca clavata]
MNMASMLFPDQGMALFDASDTDILEASFPMHDCESCQYFPVGNDFTPPTSYIPNVLPLPLLVPILTSTTPPWENQTPMLPTQVVDSSSPTDRRRRCSHVNCTSQARAYGKCKRHGGSKRCAVDGCLKSVQSRGLCIRHGGGSRCKVQDCTRASQSLGLCKLHGGGRPCIMPGCSKKAHMKQLCRQHGGGAKCRLDGCIKWAQRNHLCLTHARLESSPQ